MARSHVARELVKLGGDPIYREGVVTDNGNVILDVYNFSIPQPLAMEAEDQQHHRGGDQRAVCVKACGCFVVGDFFGSEDPFC